MVWVCVKWMENVIFYCKKLICYVLCILIKQGYLFVLEMFGFGVVEIEFLLFYIQMFVVQFGEVLEFESVIWLILDCKQQFVIDFIVYWCKVNGEIVFKVFKLKIFILVLGECILVSKCYLICLIMICRYYFGLQVVELQVNGKVCGCYDFELVMEN